MSHCYAIFGRDQREFEFLALDQESSSPSSEWACFTPAHLLQMPCSGPRCAGLPELDSLQRLLELWPYFSQLLGEKTMEKADLSAYRHID
jgi:hypothetical protein